MEYTFKLNYQLSNDDATHDDLVERLGVEGCDDALIGIGQPGRIALEFTRAAESPFLALTSAVADIKRAIPSAKLIEAGPDLVGLSDIADVVGVTRQNMRKLAIGNFTSFPSPVHEGSSALWHLADVLDWLSTRGGTSKVAPGVLEISTTAKQLNLAKQAQQIDPDVFCQFQLLWE